MFSHGHTRSALRQQHTSIPEDPSLEHFEHLVVHLPIAPTHIGRSIVWRCRYCPFEIQSNPHGKFLPEAARKHLSQCTSDWIDPDVVTFFANEVESLAFSSNLCFPLKTTSQRLYSASVSNSLHSTSYRNTLVNEHHS